MPSKPCNMNAERLKAQGNELHQKGKYRAAQAKYTEAIKEDPTNAIYHANRAACGLALKEYLDAVKDAMKATELDPNYAKAWSRLASAEFGLSNFKKSIDAWETALKCLPPNEQSSDSDKKLREQFTEGLAKAKKARDAPPEKVLRFTAAQKMPWDKAAALEEKYVAEKKMSSVFVVLPAYREFKEGVDDMKKLHQINGQIIAHNGALTNITNGILRDPRVFHINSNDWIMKYNQQVSFEAQLHSAWIEGGAFTVRREAPKRLQRGEGWNRVRQALSTTIRAWIMCGFMANSTGKFATAMEYYSRITDVQTWGVREWNDVAMEDRGVIFEKTFIRGVKRLKLTAMHGCVAKNVKEAAFTREDLVELARDIIADVDANPPDAEGEPLDVGFIASFWMYPRGEAFSILGWHYMQLGNAANTSDDAQDAYSKSAEFYTEAVKCYPEDDEAKMTFCEVAIEAYWYCPKGLRLGAMFRKLAELDAYLRAGLEIWEHSAAAEGRNAQVSHALAFANRCQEAFENGKVTLDDLVRPKNLKNQFKWGENFVYI